MCLRVKPQPLKAEVKFRRNIPATAALFFMLTAQVVTAAHFLLIPHTIDETTFKVIRARVPHEHAKSPEDTGHDTDNHSAPGKSTTDEECPICVLLHQSKIPVIAPASIFLVALMSSALATPRPDTPAVVHRRIYRVSPSHSPPGA